MKRKLTYQIIIIILFLGCKPVKKEIMETYLSIVHLNNELGSIKIRIPNSLDTNKKTFHISDYKCGDKVCFIYCNKKIHNYFPDTTGEFEPIPEIQDSVNLINIEIIQRMHPNCNTTFEDIDESYLKMLAEHQLELNPNSIILKKEIVDLRNSKLAIIMYADKERKNRINITGFFKMKEDIISIGCKHWNYSEKDISEVIYKCIKGIEIEK